MIVHGLLEAIVVVAPTADEASRAALRRQAQMIRDASFEQFAEPWDRDRIAKKLKAAENAPRRTARVSSIGSYCSLSMRRLTASA